MRAKADEFEAFGIRFAVDENQIRLDVAVSVIAPFSAERVVKVPARERRVGGEHSYNVQQDRIERLTVPS